MKFLFKIIFVFLFAVNANCQVYFNNNYDLYQYEGSTSVIEDNGYFMLGQEITTNYRCLFFTKTDINGDTLWTKHYPRDQYAYYTGLSNSLIKTYDNNYAFAGTIINLLDTIDEGNCLLVKLTNAGDTLWTKNFGGSQLDIANAVIQSSDSGYVLIGSTSSYGSGLSDIFMIKTDSLGNFEWQKTFGSGLDEEAVCIQNTLDGGYVISGRKGGGSHVVKVDSLGNSQWQFSYSGTTGISYIKQLADSTYILSGGGSVVGLGYQCYLMKINKDGSAAWQKYYGGPSDEWLYSAPIILDDGSIVVSGIAAYGVQYGLLLKADSLGNEKWLRTYYKNTIYNDFFDVKRTSDNGFVMTGTTYVSTQDLWLIKIDSNGCEIANCNVGIDEFQISDSKLQAYPNPATSEINISLIGEDLIDYQIFIHNILGEVQKTKIENSKISLEAFSSGVYFITAIKENKRFACKFIKH